MRSTSRSASPPHRHAKLRSRRSLHRLRIRRSQHWQNDRSGRARLFHPIAPPRPRPARHPWRHRKPSSCPTSTLRAQRVRSLSSNQPRQAPLRPKPPTTSKASAANITSRVANRRSCGRAKTGPITSRATHSKPSWSRTAQSRSYRVEKRWFMEGTEEFRQELFERWRAKQTMLALRKLRGRLLRISEDGSLNDRQKAARVVARSTIVEFVTERMPAIELPNYLR